MFSNRIAPLLLATVMAVTMVGCDRGDDRDDGPASPASGNAPLTGAETQPVSDTVTLLTENTPPVNYLDANGKPAGLSVELVREMAKRVGHSGRIKVVPWARGYKDLQAKPNIALFSTYRSVARESLFKWVGPLLVKEAVLYRKKGSDIRLSTLDDAKKVGAIGA
jgi:polar amino acid transport system substrate-binding protein